MRIVEKGITLKTEDGNALFLILIAVALFAALSYAVTQSGRGGGGIEREQRSLDISQLHNQISLIQYTRQQMSVVSGVNREEINFCDTDVSVCLPADFCETGTDCFFADEGGGFTQGLSHPDRLCETGTCDWRWQEIAIDGLGTTADDSLLWLGPLSDAACTTYNESIDLSTVPEYGDGTNALGNALETHGTACSLIVGDGRYLLHVINAG